MRANTKKNKVTYHSCDPFTISRVLELVKPELLKAASGEDLNQRLARLGFGFRETAKGRMLTTLPHGVEITPMPAMLSRF